MNYDFDRIIDRSNTYSMKYDDDGYFLRMLPQFRLDQDTLRIFLADMDFQCAPAITTAMHRVADFSTFGYTTADSTPEYKDSIVRWYKKRYQLELKREWIIPSNGALDGVHRTIEVFSAAGDGVIICGPAYSNFTSTIKRAGRRVVNCQMLLDGPGEYRMDWDNFTKACEEPDNKVFILCSPVNPTGRLWSADELKRMASICRRNDMVIVCDEIHSDIIRKGNQHLPIVQAVDDLRNIVMVAGACKSFNLMGLHCAYSIIPDDSLRQNFLQGYAEAMPTPFVIAALIAAYDESEDWLDALNDYLDNTIAGTLTYLHEKLPKVKAYLPQATYIHWLDFTEYGYSPEMLTALINRIANVGLQPGRAHDPVNGAQYQRMCVTSPKAVIFEAIDRIAEAFERFPARSTKMSDLG